MRSLITWFVISMAGGFMAMATGLWLLAVWFCIAGGYATSKYDSR